MATGYENRQGGRETFAFAPAKASQSPMTQAGGFNGPKMQGGNTSVAGGIAAASQFTQAGPSAGAFGKFFGELLEPAIKRRKEEMFVKGMVDQMSAVSGEEIRVSNSPINRIFGPDAYEEGAVFYSAKDAVNKWQSRTLADIDNLKRLPPEELTRVVAASFGEMTTGDQFTDLAVTTSLMEASQPVIGAIAKERYKWQQEESLKSWTSSVDSNASAFQDAMVTLAGTSEPEDGVSLSSNAAQNNYLASLAKPVGMDDETYRTGLISFATRAAQNGNGYAVTALKNHPGFVNLLTLEEKVKLDDVEMRYANRTLGRVAIDFAEDLDKLNFEMEFGKISSTEAMAQLATINAKIKARTGFDQDLFDYKEVVGAGKSVWTALHASLRRQEDRQWALEDQARAEQIRLAERQQEAEDEAAQILVPWAAGRVKSALAAGIGTTGKFDLLAQADYAAGNWGNIVNAYRTEQWTSQLVASNIQAQVGTSIGQEYNRDFEGGYKKFAELQKTLPAAAMTYYGKLYAPMLNYDRLVQSGVKPNTAFQRAFGNAAQYAPSPQVTKEAGDAITAWVGDNRGRGMLFGRYIGRDGLNASGAAALRNVMTRQLGVLTQNSDVPAAAHIPELYRHAKSSGAFEDYGRLGWTNPPGTQPLGGLLGLQEDEADEVVYGVIDRELKRTGFSDGASGDNYDIRRIKGRDGEPQLYVTPYGEDGAGTVTLIPFSALKSEADKLRAKRKGRQQSRAFATQPNGLAGAYR